VPEVRAVRRLHACRGGDEVERRRPRRGREVGGRPRHWGRAQERRLKIGPEKKDPKKGARKKAGKKKMGTKSTARETARGVESFKSFESFESVENQL
jgi:hypothetical protein